MPRGYEISEAKTTITGREKKVKLTAREVTRYAGSVDIESVAAVLRDKMGAKLKPPYVGIFGVEKSSRSSSKGPKGRALEFKQGDTWLSIKDDDGTYYTYDWGNDCCCQTECGGPCE
jgi:hypothetical protein